MYIIKKKSSPVIKNISVYMEIYNSSKTAYRVTSGTLINSIFENTNTTVYGVEIEDFKYGKKASIYDFSQNISDAVRFAETLIKNKNTPDQLYNIALSYLGDSI